MTPKTLKRERRAAPDGGLSSDLRAGTRRSSEEDRQITISGRGIGGKTETRAQSPRVRDSCKHERG